MKQRRKIFFFLAVIISAICGYAVFVNAGLVYAGVTVEGVAVGGLTEREVENLVQLWQQEDEKKPLMISDGRSSFLLERSKVDFSVDAKETAAAAAAIGHEGAYWDRVQKISQAMVYGCHIPLKIHYNESKLNDLIGLWQQSIDKPPQNAAVSLFRGGIIPAESGAQLETEATKNLVLSNLQSGGAVALPVTILSPVITEKEVAAAGFHEVIGSFQTQFDPAQKNRSDNIRLAARHLNGKVLAAGETFSFNDTVGPRDKEHGFKEALEIVGNEYVPGIGGGICQVSSTLYNAVLLANLKIEERYNHSKALGYVKLGRDATVAYQVLDFKFTNTTAEPLLITAEVVENRLSVGLFSRMKQTCQVEIITEAKKTLLPGVVRKVDENLLLGETEVERQGTPGYEVTTLRLIKRENGEVQRELIAKDQYLPEDSIVRIGSCRPDFSK
ncbi:MAG: VanW family protein [Sporomusaceae bacterium]|nr:VanW family protein [Sporomusaceae bacterium]